MKDSAPCS